MDTVEILKAAIKKIPCELAIVTNGRWLKCQECPRCRILGALNHSQWLEIIADNILTMEDDGGIVFNPKSEIPGR